MTHRKKVPEHLREIPRAQTLPQGSYRLVPGPGEAVVVKPSVRGPADVSKLNGTDWMLLLIDAGWEKAEQAYYKGLEEGFLIGQQEGRMEARKSAAAFGEALNTVEISLLKFYSGLERWAVKLAMKIAEKVVGRAADEHQELVQQTVRRAIAEAADKTRILIKVNPSDYDALRDFRADVTALSEGVEHFKIEADVSITPGSCRVETPSGLVDADFTTQLGELRRALILQEEARG